MWQDFLLLKLISKITPWVVEKKYVINPEDVILNYFYFPKNFKHTHLTNPSACSKKYTKSVSVYTYILLPRLLVLERSQSLIISERCSALLPNVPWPLTEQYLEYFDL